MKCIYCQREIEYEEDHQIHGVDGDFIHTACVPKWESQCKRINEMTDEEFKSWMLGGE